MLAHRDLSDCWGVLSIILGSLPYSIKQLEVTVVVVLSYINNIVSIYFQLVRDKKLDMRILQSVWRTQVIQEGTRVRTS